MRSIEIVNSQQQQQKTKKKKHFRASEIRVHLICLEIYNHVELAQQSPFLF